MNQVFFIAEAGVNHNGSTELARQLIDVAIDAGANAIKFQTFRTELLVTQAAATAAYQKANTGGVESQFEMLKALELTSAQHIELWDYCKTQGIQFLSTPFDEGSADFLESLGMLAFKTPSGELTNLPYLRHIALKGKPMIVSTGMARLGEVEAAIEAIESAGNNKITLLHCVSNYPAKPEEINLRAMNTLASFGYPVGYSDHSQGIGISLAAIALGAKVIEKHFTLSRDMPGPDHKASLEPAELKALIQEARAVELSLGSPRKRPNASELDTASVARKSLVTAIDIPAGTELTMSHIRAMRPGTGIPPAQVQAVVGRKARKAIPMNTLLDWNMLE